MRYCSFALLLVAFALPLSAQDNKSLPAFECRWAAGPITINGKAEEPAWQKAELIDNFARPWLPENERRSCFG